MMMTSMTFTCENPTFLLLVVAGSIWGNEYIYQVSWLYVPRYLLTTVADLT